MSSLLHKRSQKMKHSLKKPEKQDIIESLSSYLLRQRKDISVVYLFGSFISEESFSDIDLGILTQIEPMRILDFEFRLENQLEQIANHQIDVRFLNNAPISFCQNVIRNGQVILDRDSNLRSDFEGQVLKKYFDFSRFRLQYLAEVKNAPI